MVCLENSIGATEGEKYMKETKIKLRWFSE